MKLRSTIGAAAVTRLVELKGASVKDELLQSLSEARDDYNYCVNGIGTALSRFATPDDVPKIVALADGIQNEFPPHGDRRVVQGFSSGAATFLAGLDVLVVKQWFLPTDEPGRPSELKARILCEILHRHHVTAALDFAGELLLRGVDEAATAIYFISQFSKPEDQLSWANFTSDHVDRLVSGLDEEKEEVWALRALRCLCEARPDLASTVMAHALKASGIAKVALLYCASSSNTAAVFQALAELVEMDAAKRRGEPIYILKQIELDWAGHEALLVQLFRLRDTRLALALLGEVYHGVGI
jgi:hypothetical protein